MFVCLSVSFCDCVWLTGKYVHRVVSADQFCLRVKRGDEVLSTILNITPYTSTSTSTSSSSAHRGGGERGRGKRVDHLAHGWPWSHTRGRGRGGGGGNRGGERGRDKGVQASQVKYEACFPRCWTTYTQPLPGNPLSLYTLSSLHFTSLHFTSL